MAPAPSTSHCDGHFDMFSYGPAFIVLALVFSGMIIRWFIKGSGRLSVPSLTEKPPSVADPSNEKARAETALITATLNPLITPTSYQQAVPMLPEPVLTTYGENHENGSMFCKALYDFPGTTPSELGFKKGDVIEILTTCDSGWWDGLLSGRRGWIPSNYVEVVQEAGDA